MIPTHELHEQSGRLNKALTQSRAQKFRLKLFVTGNTPRSLSAITQIKQICEAQLQGRYSLEVVDMYQQPRSAKEENILAAPTLIKYEPTPLCRLVGSMANTSRVLQALNLQAA